MTVKTVPADRRDARMVTGTPVRIGGGAGHFKGVVLVKGTWK
jgi:hypothetical protein